jgi:hypothetical protein
MISQSPLDNLKVANPCHASWERMEWEDDEGRVRYCRSCQKNVYNLSALNRDEAEALIEVHESHFCARFAQREDGTLVSGDCSSDHRDSMERSIIWALVFIIALAMFQTPLGSAFLANLSHIVVGHRVVTPTSTMGAVVMGN